MRPTLPASAPQLGLVVDDEPEVRAVICEIDSRASPLEVAALECPR
jgi:hypothetical protein